MFVAQISLFYRQVFSIMYQDLVKSNLFGFIQLPPWHRRFLVMLQMVSKKITGYKSNKMVFAQG